MNLRHLEVFRTVMETGTTLAAARLLLVSQPAISNLIKQFEAQVGFKLFLRVGGRLRPTKEARYLYEKSEAVFTAFSSVQTLAEDLRRGWAGKLQLVSSPSIGHSIIPEALAKFHADRPHIRINMDTPSNERIVEMLAGSSIDVGFTITPIEHPSITSRVLKEGAVLCALPVGHKLEALERIAPRDLSDAALISYPRDSAIGGIVNGVFRDAGEFPMPFIEVRFTLTALRLVQSGMGVALVDQFTASAVHKTSVVLRPVATKRTIPLVLSQPRHEELSALARTFVDEYLLPHVA